LSRTIELAPSILSANFANLAEHAKQALDGGGTLLHVDVMDGHFVPTLRLGHRWWRRCGKHAECDPGLPLDD